MKIYGTANLPDIEDGEDIIKHLVAIGFCREGMSGFVGITFQELDAWMRSTGNDLPPWEAETVVKLSQTYAQWVNKSRDIHCEPPFDLDHNQVRALHVQNKIFG